MGKFRNRKLPDDDVFLYRVSLWYYCYYLESPGPGVLAVASLSQPTHCLIRARACSLLFTGTVAQQPPTVSSHKRPPTH